MKIMIGMIVTAKGSECGRSETGAPKASRHEAWVLLALSCCPPSPLWKRAGFFPDEREGQDHVIALSIRVSLSLEVRWQGIEVAVPHECARQHSSQY